MKTNSRRSRRTKYSHPSAFILHPLLSLFMISVFAATATELAKLKPIRRGLFILGRYVVAALAYNTLKNNIIAWHLFLFPELCTWFFVLSKSLDFALCSLLFAFCFFVFFEISNLRSQISDSKT